MKKYHDQNIEERDFLVGVFVLLFNSRLLVSGKTQVQMKWSILDHSSFPHGAVGLENKKGVSFKVNGQ